jgi:predicted Zn-dependent peptidase
MYKKTVLKNGLRIIAVPDKNTQAVTVLLLVKTGSKNETKEINGISHFLEHMLFKGTKKRPTSTEVAEALDKIGGNYNAFTSEDFTGYFAKVEASHFDLALDWVADIYLNSLLPQKEIKKEKGVIVEEINMYYDNPMMYIFNLWKKLLYGDQPAGWSVAGEKKSVRGITREQLSYYWKHHYTASNSLVCIAGNVESKEAIKKIKKYFSGLSKGKIRSKSKVVEKQDKPNSLFYFKKTDQTHLCLGVRAYNLYHPQKYAAELLAVILGGMMSSRMFIRIREQLGLAYYVVTSLENDPDTGFLFTRAGVDNKNADKAIRAILEEYKKIRKETVSLEELQKAKDYIKGKMALSLEASDALASFYGGQELLENKILTQKQIFEEIDKVTAKDILKVAQDIFKPKKLNLALLGPFENKKIFENLLKEF